MHRTHSLHLDYSQDKLVKKTRDDKAEDDDENENDPDMPDDFKPFSIRNPGECTSDNQYGYTRGRPCVLVKMNKVDLSSLDALDRTMDRTELISIRFRLSTSSQWRVCQAVKKLNFMHWIARKTREYRLIVTEK